jgi:phage terminase small subunit
MTTSNQSMNPFYIPYLSQLACLPGITPRPDGKLDFDPCSPVRHTPCRQTGRQNRFNHLPHTECPQFAAPFQFAKPPGKQGSVRRLVTGQQTSQSCRDLVVTSAPPQLTRNDSRPSLCRHHYPALGARPCESEMRSDTHTRTASVARWRGLLQAKGVMGAKTSQPYANETACRSNLREFRKRVNAHRTLKVQKRRNITLMKTKQSQSTNITAPEHLSERSKELWRQLQPVHAKSLGRQELLRVGLEALDRCDQARSLIDAEGMTSITESTKAVHVHPGTRIEREARMQVIKIWELLRLTWNQAIDGR